METLVRGKVELQPWQAILPQMEAWGLTAEDGIAKAWYVSADRTHITGGAAAINDALRHIWYLRPFTYLYRLWGVRQLQDRIYQWIADNRYRLPGSTAACELPASQQDRAD